MANKNTAELTQCLDAKIKSLNEKDPSGNLSQRYLEEADKIYERLTNYEKKGGESIALGNKLNIEAAEATLYKHIQERHIELKTYELMEFLKKAEQTSGVSQGEVLLDTMVGGKVLYKGSRNAVDMRGKALQAEFIGGLINDLEEAGLWKHIEDTKSGVLKQGDKGFQLQIARAMEQLNNPEQIADLLKKGLITQEAVDIANVFRKWQNVAIDSQNRLGAYITPMWDYIVKQSHNMMKIRNISLREGLTKAGRLQALERSKKEWKDFILPLLDKEKTFGDALDEDVDRILSDIWSDLSTGRHYNRGYDSDANVLGRRQSLADKISADRVLHFKDADNWFTYNTKYGSGDLMDAIFGGFMNASKNIAVMEKFGPDPQVAFARVMAQLGATHPEDVKGWRGTRLRTAFDVVSGIADIPSDATWAKVGRGIRAWNIMTKLGGALLSSFTDTAFMSHELAFQGMNMLSAHAKSLAGFMEAFKGEERKQLARTIGVGIDGMIGDILSRFSYAGGDDVGGKMSKMVSQYFKWNLLEQWTDANKSSIGFIMANRLSEMKGHNWVELGAKEGKLRKMLEAFNIDETKWNILREINTKELPYITSDAIMQLSDDVILKHASVDMNIDRVRPLGDDAVKKVVDEYRTNLSTELRAYYVDRANMGVPTPGARQKITMFSAPAAGTVWGEAARFLWQFKSFPLTVAQNVLGWDFARGGGMKKGLLSYTDLMVSLTALGYLSMTLKDLARGQEPRGWDYMTGKKNLSEMEPGDAVQIALAAFVQGGGAGLYGDLVFGTTTRYGQSALESAAGPTWGHIAGVANFLGTPVEWARKGKVPKDAFNTMASKVIFGGIKQNIPYANMFYTKAALDYGLFYSAQEAMNPGSVRQMERKLRDEQNREFLYPPSKNRLRPFE